MINPRGGQPDYARAEIIARASLATDIALVLQRASYSLSLMTLACAVISALIAFTIPDKPSFFVLFIVMLNVVLVVITFILGFTMNLIHRYLKIYVSRIMRMGNAAR